MAATILIDFNDNSTAGAGWNVFHAGNDGTTQNLILDDGTDSGIDIALPTFNDSGNPGWNPANSLPAWAPNSVVNDYSFFNAFFDGGTASAQFTLSNLDPTAVFTIEIVSSRNLDREQDFTITHGGGTTVFNNWNNQTDGYQNGTLLTFAGLTADGANEIAIAIERDGTSAAFNAIRITYDTPVPEPSTALLLGLGLAMLSGAPTRRS